MRYGKPQSLESIGIDDVLAHPIWVWVWEAGLEGAEGVEDETWQCPVLDTNDVGKGMTSPVITLRVEGSDLVATASLEGTTRLAGISVWHEGEWVDLGSAGLKAPVVFVAVPSVRGVSGVRFSSADLKVDEAKRLR